MYYKTKKDYIEDQMINPFKDASSKGDIKTMERIFYFVAYKLVEQMDWTKAYSSFVKGQDMKIVNKFEELHYDSYMEMKDCFPDELEEDVDGDDNEIE